MRFGVGARKLESEVCPRCSAVCATGELDSKRMGRVAQDAAHCVVDELLNGAGTGKDDFAFFFVEPHLDHLAPALNAVRDLLRKVGCVLRACQAGRSGCRRCTS